MKTTPVMIPQFSNWSIGEGDWNTLVAVIDPENVASQRVVEKVDFREGDLQDEEHEMWTKGGKAKKLVRHREWLLSRPV